MSIKKLTQLTEIAEIADADLLHIVDVSDTSQDIEGSSRKVSIAQLKEEIETTVQEELDEHIEDTNNPHEVSKTQVGLGNVDNTSDLNKPVSTATQNALTLKVDKETGKGLSTNDYTTIEKNKLSGIEEGAEVNNISDVNATDLTDSGDSTLHYHSSDRNRANHTGTQTASTISDFDTEVSNNTDVSANSTARHTHSNKNLLDTYTQTEVDLADAVSKKHSAVTVTDTDEIDLTLTGQDIKADIKTSSIAKSKLDSGVQASLGKADTALQSESQNLQEVTDNGATTTNSITVAGITTPTVIGGTGTTDDLILQTTSGVGTTGADMIFKGGNNGATEFARFLNNGNLGIGVTSPTSVLHLKAGTATASTAPLKFTSGTVLTTPEAGTLEYNGVHYMTGSDLIRRQIAYQTPIPGPNGYVYPLGDAPQIGESGATSVTLPVKTVTSITLSGSTATVTATAHGFSTGMTISITGAGQAEYNLVDAPITVVDPDTFTYTVSGTPATPATGTIKATNHWVQLMRRNVFSDWAFFLSFSIQSAGARDYGYVQVTGSAYSPIPAKVNYLGENGYGWFQDIRTSTQGTFQSCVEIRMATASYSYNIAWTGTSVGGLGVIADVAQDGVKTNSVPYTQYQRLTKRGTIYGTNAKFTNIYPTADSTTALRTYNTDGTTVLNTIDTTNLRQGWGVQPIAEVDVNSSIMTRRMIQSPGLVTNGVYVLTPSPDTTYTNGSSGSYVIKNAVAPNGRTEATTLTLTNTTYNMYRTVTGLTSGKRYRFGAWVKLGTATNFVVVLNNRVAWNTVGGKEFTTSDGLSTSVWKYISYSFPAPASTEINIHLGAHSETGVTQQTAGTVLLFAPELVSEEDTSVGNLTMGGRLSSLQGKAVASANNLSLGYDGNSFEITGTTQVNLISSLGWQDGSVIRLLFTSTVTLKHNQTSSGTDIKMLLYGSADFTSSADGVVNLILSTVGGVRAWRETLG